MPRSVRNFFLNIDVDGKKTSVATGPRGKGGGFRCRVLVRADGQVHHDDLTVEGVVRQDGLLELKVWDGGNVIFKRITKR
jgi:hypothetical protein